MREVRSFCRFCMVFCGTRVSLDENDHIIGVRGDHDVTLPLREVSLG